MSIEHRTLVLSLLLAACGIPSETENRRCGDSVVSPGEDCDGTDLGGHTCMDAVHRGGTLQCNADCTLDVSGCTLASCGNGVAETGEACDGADLRTGSCASIGFAAGNLACSSDCSYDVSTCCSDSCATAGVSSCIGDTLRTCVAASSGCLSWQVTDCAASDNICNDSSGTAACTCVDRCPGAGTKRCEGATIETCADVAGCLNWTLSTNCASDSSICTVAPGGPTCAPDISAEDCDEPYPLKAGQNIVAWTALDADYVTAQPSCNTTTLEGPDLVLSYTAPENGFIRFAMQKPASARQIFVVSRAACGTVSPEVACVSDFTPTNIGTDFAVEMGVTYYFYVRDTNSGTAPLDNPLLVTVAETRCSTSTPSVTSLSPSDGVSIPDQTPIFSASFDFPVDPTQGVITLTGTMGTNLAFDLAMGPAEIAILDGGRTLQIDPGLVFPVGETLTVAWTGLRDKICGKLIAAPAWTVPLTGPPYTITSGTTVYSDACVGGTVQTINGTVDEGRTNPISLPAGFQFFKQPATQILASTNGWLSTDVTVASAVFSNVAMPNNAAPNGMIAPYWDDLDDIVICTKTVGNALVVQWTGDLFSNNATLIQFQAILDPSDNSMEFVYGPSQQPDGVSATVGVEDQAGAYAVQYESNTAGTITPNSSKKLTPN